MIELPIKPSQQISVGLLLYGYATLLSGAYTFGYWTPLGFNPFPYMTAKDVITAPLSNLLILLAPFILLIPVSLLDQGALRTDVKYFRIILYVHWLLYLSLIMESLYLAWSNGLNFADERRVMAMTGILLMMSYGLSRRHEREPWQRFFPLLSVISAQLAIVLSGGYQSGKEILSDRSLIKSQVHAYSLVETSLCKSGKEQQWIYLEKYSDSAIFYDRSSRMLCLTDKKDYKLKPTRIKLQKIAP